MATKGQKKSTVSKSSPVSTAFRNAKEWSSFAGAHHLHHRLKEKGAKSVNRKRLQKELIKTEPGYALHFPMRKHFPRAQIMARYPDEMWQADLVDLGALATRNKNFRYLLTVIDVVTKYAWAIPIKKKTGIEVTTAFAKIFDTSNRIPHTIVTDRGKEFLNKDLRSFLKQENTELLPSQSDLKASMVERFNKTLKERMWRYFTATGTHKYLDVLPDIMKAYNNTPHRTIGGMRPEEVTLKNFKTAWAHQYGMKWPGFNRSRRKPKFLYQIGDQVRVSRLKGVFDKGYLPNWSEDLFTITKRISWTPVAYKIKRNSTEEILDGVFYEPELLPGPEK